MYPKRNVYTRVCFINSVNVRMRGWRRDKKTKGEESANGEH